LLPNISLYNVVLIQLNGAELLYLHAWKNTVAHQKLKQTVGQNKNNLKKTSVMLSLAIKADSIQ
jgi:hypothetical protein